MFFFYHFTVNAPPNNGSRNTPTPTSENNTVPTASTATAAMIYFAIFFMSL